MQAGGVDFARSGGELGVYADALIRDVTGARAGLEISLRRSLDLIVDADIAQVFVMAADADDVARLLDGGMGSNLPHPLLARAPARLYPAEDVHLVARALGQMDVARAGGDRQLHFSVYGQRALEGGLRGQRRKRRQGQGRRNCYKKMFHRVPFVAGSRQPSAISCLYSKSSTVPHFQVHSDCQSNIWRSSMNSSIPAAHPVFCLRFQRPNPNIHARKRTLPLPADR